MIAQTTKQKIMTALKKYVVTFKSQKKAAESFENVSEATIISILSGQWASISDSMWTNVANQIGLNKRQFNVVETNDYKTLTLYYDVAKEEGATFSIIGRAGCGKTFTGKHYTEVNRKNNVYYLECANYWNKKQFLQKLLSAIGKDEVWMNIGDMMETIVRELRRQHKPLIILDEIDKLTDPVLTFFITLYNELNSVCGFVWTSTNNIEKRIASGLRKNALGYQELFSRIGSRFIELQGVTSEEIKAICQANGIEKEEDIHRIINESAGDLRRVERNFLKDRAKEIRSQKARTSIIA